MKNIVRFWITSLTLVLALTLAACGGGGAAPAPTAAPSGDAAGGGAEAPSGGGAPISSAEVTAKGEQLLFSVSEIGPFSAGSEATITFKNTSSINQHNLLIVKGDRTVTSAVNDAGAEVGPSGAYVPDDPAIVAHTSLLDPGSAETISFTPEPGATYYYICTVPGHYVAGMIGEITLVP